MPIMAATRTLLVVAVTGCALLLACRDDPEKTLSEAGISETQLAQSRQEPPPASLPALKAAAEPGGNSELPGGLGRYEIVHDTNQARVEVRFAPPAGDVQNAVLWLAGPNGPVSVKLEPYAAGGSRCLAARSELLREPVSQGILRFEVDGRRCRVPLGTTRPETQPASPKSTSPSQPEST